MEFCIGQPTRADVSFEPREHAANQRAQVSNVHVFPEPFDEVLLGLELFHQLRKVVSPSDGIRQPKSQSRRLPQRRYRCLRLRIGIDVKRVPHELVAARQDLRCR